MRLLITLLHAHAQARSAATSISSSIMSSTTPRHGLSRRLRVRSPTIASGPLSDWDGYLATLDTAILSLIGENDIADEDIPAALDDILQSSLWERRLNRRRKTK